MASYRAYGLRIEADVALPVPTAGPTAASSPPDLVIRERPLYHSQHSQEVSAEMLGALEEGTADVFETNGRDTIFGRIYDELYFVVTEGRYVYYDPKKDLPEGVLQGYLLGVLMATVLRQRGYLVLHACGLARDGHGLTFVGESGWGKSTLAEYFCQQGYTLLNDDVMAIDTQGGPAVILPGYPQIRLREEAGRHLRPDFAALPTVNATTAKRISMPARFPDAPVPLTRMYMLAPTYTDANRLQPLSQQEATMRLVRHTRATNLLSDAAVTAGHLQQCAALARQVPIRHLHRVKDLHRLPEIQALVEEDLAAANTVAS